MKDLNLLGKRPMGHAQTRAGGNRRVQDGGDRQPQTSNLQNFPAPVPGQNNSTPDQRRENLSPG